MAQNNFRDWGSIFGNPGLLGPPTYQPPPAFGTNPVLPGVRPRIGPAVTPVPPGVRPRFGGAVNPAAAGWMNYDRLMRSAKPGIEHIAQIAAQGQRPPASTDPVQLPAPAFGTNPALPGQRPRLSGSGFAATDPTPGARQPWMNYDMLMHSAGPGIKDALAREAQGSRRPVWTDPPQQPSPFAASATSLGENPGSGSASAASSGSYPRPGAEPGYGRALRMVPLPYGINAIPNVTHGIMQIIRHAQTRGLRDNASSGGGGSGPYYPPTTTTYDTPRGVGNYRDNAGSNSGFMIDPNDPGNPLNTDPNIGPTVQINPAGGGADPSAGDPGTPDPYYPPTTTTTSGGGPYPPPLRPGQIPPGSYFDLTTMSIRPLHSVATARDPGSGQQLDPNELSAGLTSQNFTGNTGDEGHDMYQNQPGQRTWVFDPETGGVTRTGPIFGGGVAQPELTPDQIAQARALLQQNFNQQFAMPAQNRLPPPDSRGIQLYNPGV